MTALLTLVVCATLQAAPGPFGDNPYLEAYRAMTVLQLRAHMAQEVPTRRGFVAQALAERGTDAWGVLADALRSSDWRVRACAVQALEMLLPKVRSAAEKAQQRELLKTMPGVIDGLLGALADDHFWVRCLAAGVVGNLGAPAAAAGPALAQLCAQDHPWVRERALFALDGLPEVATEVRLQGAINALNHDRTSFADARFAFSILRQEGQHLQDAPDLPAALYHFLEFPGEAMWSDTLAEGLALLMTLAWDSEHVVPLFEKVLTDPAYEQRGDPRVIVCHELPKLGADARKLAPALRQAIARENALIARGKYNRAGSIIGELEKALAALP